jgi:hypothetical protein
MKRILPLLILASATLAWSATPATGTLTGAGSTITWAGGTLSGVNGDAINDTAGDPLTPGTGCTLTNSCETFTLVVNLPATFYTTNPNYGVQIAINWASVTNDFDIYLFDSAGNQMFSSAQQLSTSEFIDAGRLASGTYTLLIVAAAAVNATYTGTASVVPEPSVPSGRARYTRGNFVFNTPQQLMRPNDVLNVVTSNAGILFALDQDVEPRVVHDPLGNLYAAAIEGVPGGVDVWKSMDGGTTWSYLGEPDGAQALATFGLTGVGVGGGDEDLATAPNGSVYMDSLWLGAVTQTVSTNGGNTWTNNPAASDLPGDDRQWIAPFGNQILYETYKQVGALLNGTDSIFVAKSFDGGLTFTQITEVTTPELGIQPGVQGNITVDQSNGYVYTVFTGADGGEIYLARSTDGGQTWIIKLVYQGASGVLLQNVFPVVAVDAGSNVHIVFSDSRNVYLTSSSDQGASFTPPVRVNNGAVTKTAVSPWVTAGSAGKVNIQWWGTSHTNSMDFTDPWQVFMAQTQNAFANVPTFAQLPATGVMHVGAICVNGLACTPGTRNLAEYQAADVGLDGNALIVYPDDKNSGTATGAARTWFVKQVGGATVK